MSKTRIWEIFGTGKLFHSCYHSRLPDTRIIIARFSSRPIEISLPRYCRSRAQ